jgi:hypothetical protein
MAAPVPQANVRDGVSTGFGRTSQNSFDLMVALPPPGSVLASADKAPDMRHGKRRDWRGSQCRDAKS